MLSGGTAKVDCVVGWLQRGSPMLSGGGVTGSDGPAGVGGKAAGAHVLPDVPHRLLPGLLRGHSIQ